MISGLGAALAVVIVGGVGMLLASCCNRLTSDDVFFLDAAFTVLDHRLLALQVWGNALGHQDFLGSYPPAIPLVTTLDGMLFRLWDHVNWLRTTGVVLMAIGAALLWYAFGVVRSSSLRLALVVLTFADPLIRTFFLSFRPEKVLMLEMLGLYLASSRLLVEWRGVVFVWVIALSVLGAMTHWQFLFTVAAVFGLLVVLWRSGRTPGVAVVAYGSTMVALYGAYAAWIASSPARLAAWRMQLGVMGGSLTLTTKLKILAGNLVQPNWEGGSAFGVLLLSTLASVALRCVLSSGNGQRDDARSVRFTAWFLGLSLVPSLYVDYIGPRAVPLYLICVSILVHEVANRRKLGVLVGIVAACSAANYGGDTLLGYIYVNRGVLEIWRWSVVWFAVGAIAAAAWFMGFARSAYGAWSIVVTLLGLCVANAAAAANVHDATVLSQRRVEELSRRLAGTVNMKETVLTDAALYYLPLLRLQRGVRVVADFPIFHFREAWFFERFVGSVRSDVILLSQRSVEAMRRYPDVGRRLRAQLEDFTIVDSFTVDGIWTGVYRRRAGPGSR